MSSRRALGLTADTVRLASPALERDPSQLAGQLLGRLSSSTEGLRRLLLAAGDAKAAPWLRPKRNTLIPPGILKVRFVGHAGTPRTVAISADGSHAVSSGNSTPDQTVRLWDLEGARGLHVVRGAATASGFTPVALSGDGRLALIGDAGRIDGFDVGSGRRIWTLAQRDHGVAWLTVAAAAPVAAAVWTDGALTVWDLAARRTLVDLSCREPAHRVSLSGDGRLVVAGEPTGLELIDVTSARAVQALESGTGLCGALDDPPVSVASPPERVYFGPPPKAWVLATGAVDVLDTTPWSVLAVSASGRVLGATADGRLILDGGGAMPALPGSPSAAAITPDGSRAVVADYEHGLSVCDLDAARTSTWGVPTGGPVDDVLIAADGLVAVSLSLDGAMTAWSTATGEPIASQAAAREAGEHWAHRRRRDQALVDATGLDRTTWAQTPDGRYAVGTAWDWLKYGEEPEPDSGADTWPVPVRDAVSGRLAWLVGHSSPVVAVAVTDDGRLAASASFGRVIRVWDLDSRAQTQILRTDEGIAWGLAAFPGPRRLVSASEGGTVVVWNLERAERIATFTGDFGMRCCVVDRAGRTVVAGDDAGGVHVLQLI